MKRLVALVLALMMLGCVALGEGEGLHYLTKEDIVQIYNPDALASYQDDTMAEPVVSGTAAELALTDEEIEQIRAMDLTICLQQDHLDDAMKLIQQAFQDACDELGITLGSVWMAADQSGAAARSDYENFLSVTDEYDAFFTCLSDASLNTDILKEIMEEIPVGYMLAVPLDMDWENTENFIGVTDINAKEAGIQSAKAAVAVLEGEGVIGTVGYENGRTGDINTCFQRYEGWNEVFEEAGDSISVVQTWYDDPANSKALIQSMLASNPEIEVLLIDWSYPVADYALQVCNEMGLVAGEDIYIVSIDYDNAVTIPMATYGEDSYVAACVAQDWYKAGYNLVYMYARYLLDNGENTKFVAANPAPVTNCYNVQTTYGLIIPETVEAIPMVDEVAQLENQWTLEDMGIENAWN